MSNSGQNNPEYDVEVVEEDQFDGEEINLDDMVEVTEQDLEDLMQDEEDDQETEVKDDSCLTIDDHDGISINLSKTHILYKIPFNLNSKGAVFAVDSFNNLVATGGEDDKAFIWSISSSETGLEKSVLLETEKFSDSVTMLKFSQDGKYLAVCDMSGKIRVYLVGEPCELFWEYDVGSDLESLDWHPGCNVLFSGTADGQFIMFKISTNESKIMYSGDDCSLSCFQILKDGKHAVCCYNNGNIRMWDLKSGQPAFSLVKAHEEDIISLDATEDGKLVATGGIDLKVNIITPMNGKIVWKFTVDSPKPKEDTEENDDNNNVVENSIESVGFCKIQPIVACCTLNGQIYAWDTNTHVLRHKLDYKFGFSKLIWDEYRLFASSLDGAVQQFEGRSFELIKKYEGHSSEILDFCLNNKLYLCTASNDQTVKIFATHQ